MRLMIAGGGTGGHLFPGIAIAEAFSAAAPGREILFVGSTRGLEARVLPQRGLPHTFLEVGRLKGLSLARKVLTLLTLPLALLRAVRIVRGFSPDVIVGVGGNVSGPVVLAGRLLGCKTAVQEQNSVPGLTNRLLGKLVHRVFTAFEAAARHFPAKKVRNVGNPIRRELAEAAAQPSPLPEQPSVLILGGSLGAKRLNEIVAESYRLLAERFPGLHWVHQTGERWLEMVKSVYAQAPGNPEPVAFIDDMVGVIRGARLVVGRAGASTLAEIAAVGRASILVPFPFATDNHQEENARELERHGAAIVFIEKDLTAAKLAEEVAALLGDRQRLEGMTERARAWGRPRAAQTIAEECAALVVEK